MNRKTLPHTDELDRKFSAFFKAQLPQKWPQAPVAKAEVAQNRTVSQFDKGRMTLAVSIACLLGLGLALSYGPTFRAAPDPSEGLLQGSNADGKNLHNHMNPDNKPKMP